MHGITYQFRLVSYPGYSDLYQATASDLKKGLIQATGQTSEFGGFYLKFAQSEASKMLDFQVVARSLSDSQSPTHQEYIHPPLSLTQKSIEISKTPVVPVFPSESTSSTDFPSAAENRVKIEKGYRVYFHDLYERFRLKENYFMFAVLSLVLAWGVPQLWAWLPLINMQVTQVLDLFRVNWLLVSLLILACCSLAAFQIALRQRLI